MMEKPLQVINQAKAYLNSYKQNILRKYRDKQLTQWDTANLEKYSDEIKLFGLPEGVEKARDQHRKLSVTILKQIEKIENELGAIALDIDRNSISPEKALFLAERTALESADLDESLKEWSNYAQCLLEADRLLREKLTVSALFPLACSLAHKGRREMVEEGYAFYLAITLEKPAAGDLTTLQGYFSQAVQLEKTLLDIDLGSLTGLPAAIINQQIKTAAAAADRLKLFIEEFRKNLPGECQSIADLQKQLTELHSAEVSTCLEKIELLTARFSKNLISLRHKRRSYKQYDYLPFILQEVEKFHAGMISRIIPELKEKLAKPGSPINPATVATDLAAEYFMGLKGFIRAIKHLFGSLGGRQTVRLGDLQQIIFKVLTTCETYYGDSDSEIGKLQNFLDEHLEVYSRPFPYEALLQLLKKAIYLYGSRVEKYLLGCKIESSPPVDEEGTVSTSGQGGTLGRLLSKVEIRTANLNSSIF
jgi:hypothetical protein